MSTENRPGWQAYSLRPPRSVRVHVIHRLHLNEVVLPHAARFSPDDRFSRQRIILKRRFSLLPTQKPDVFSR